MPKFVVAIIGVIALIVVGVGGYFLVIAINKTHKENMSSLEGFGSVVTPSGPSYGEESGQTALEPTLGVKKISTTDKIIISLSDEKNKLINELTVANEKIKDLESQIALLNNYKENNERYSPRLMDEERSFAIKNMSDYLEASEEAVQFTDFQRDVMIEQSANVYLHLVRRFHLNITDEDRDKLLSEYLPGYAFCFAQDIELVANSRQEKAKMLQYFKNNDKSLLAPSLLEDIETINDPCINRLNQQVLPYFRADLR